MASLFCTSLCAAILLFLLHTASAVNWNGNNWAMACDFTGNDLSNVLVRGEDCGGRCADTSGCTHFTWTTYNGGTCWLKSGAVGKENAFDTQERSMVCGVVDGPGNGGDKRTGVHTTRHGAREYGACALPAAEYAVVNPVALGDIDSLGNLKFRPELCGQVLNVDCGHGALSIVVTNSNLGGGLDLYGSTWSILTDNQPPGVTSCDVRLTSQNPFQFTGPRCYYKPDTEFNNAYYKNVGLLNTGGRIVTKATLDGHAGVHHGSNAYYAFNFGPIDENSEVVFTFEDGTTHSVPLRDCVKEGGQQTWS